LKVNSQNQILIISFIFIVLFSLLFNNTRIDYKDDYKKTQKELAGIIEITNIHKLNIVLKSLRGLNQLDKSKFITLKKSLFIDENQVHLDIKKLHDKSIDQLYHKITGSQNLSKEESFKRYTLLLKRLDQKRFDVADTSYLLFEEDREIYFLMSIAVLSIPDTIENIGKIRGLGVGILSSKEEEEEDKFLLQSNTQVFLNRIDEIKFILSKLSPNDAAALNILIDTIMTDFYDINRIVKNIVKSTSNISPQDYFLQTTKLINNINNLFLASKNILNTKLQQRESSLQYKLYFIRTAYIIVLFLIILATYTNYIKTYKSIQLEKKIKANQDFISKLRDEYANTLSLKQLCELSLNQIINYFKAVNGSLYLFDKDNEKLYLGSTYAIKKNDLEQTLDMHENIISENILEKQLKIIDIEKELDLGNVRINASKLVTIPILEFEKSIGTMQLVFGKKFNDIDLSFLRDVVSLMASYIFKAQKDNESLQYLKVITKNILISKTDLNGDIIDVTDEFCRLSEYSKEELIGQNHRIIKHKETPKETFIALWQTISKGQTWKGEIKNSKKNGDYYWIHTVISPDLDINGNIIGFTSLNTDITDKKKIEQIAITDGLTSLYNRRHFDYLFPKQIEISKRSKDLLAFALIDIDHFKQYNDSYGHQEGDTTLKLVAKCLKNSLKRPDDYTFRLGGEEFGMLYRIQNEEDGLTLVEQFRQNVLNLKIKHSGNSASKYVTISAGLFIIDIENIISIDGIYKKTDEALYRAKQNGRNQIKKALIV